LLHHLLLLLLLLLDGAAAAACCRVPRSTGDSVFILVCRSRASTYASRLTSVTRAGPTQHRDATPSTPGTIRIPPSLVVVVVVVDGSCFQFNTADVVAVNALITL
jgi:hypothetical protein